MPPFYLAKTVDDTQRDEALLFAQSVLASEHSDFYRRRQGVSVRSLADIFPLKWRDISVVPFRERLYVDGKRLVKIVSHGESSAFITRTLADIRVEPLRSSFARPLVGFSSVHESTMWGLWCYEHNILPLVAEMDPEVAASSAQRYGVDALIVDSTTLTSLLEPLTRRNLWSSLKEVNVLDISFSEEVLARVSHAVPRLILHACLPETGIIASSSYKGSFQDSAWEPAPHVLVEEGGDGIITKCVPMPTPLIRYRTGLAFVYPGAR